MIVNLLVISTCLALVQAETIARDPSDGFFKVPAFGRHDILLSENQIIETKCRQTKAELKGKRGERNQTKFSCQCWLKMPSSVPGNEHYKMNCWRGMPHDWKKDHTPSEASHFLNTWERTIDIGAAMTDSEERCWLSIHPEYNTHCNVVYPTSVLESFGGTGHYYYTRTTMPHRPPAYNTGLPATWDGIHTDSDEVSPVKSPPSSTVKFVPFRSTVVPETIEVPKVKFNPDATTVDGFSFLGIKRDEKPKTPYPPHYTDSEMPRSAYPPNYIPEKSVFDKPRSSAGGFAFKFPYPDDKPISSAAPGFNFAVPDTIPKPFQFGAKMSGETQKEPSKVAIKPAGVPVWRSRDDDKHMFRENLSIEFGGDVSGKSSPMDSPESSPMKLLPITAPMKLLPISVAPVVSNPIDIPGTGITSNRAKAASVRPLSDPRRLVPNSSPGIGFYADPFVTPPSS